MTSPWTELAPRGYEVTQSPDCLDTWYHLLRVNFDHYRMPPLFRLSKPAEEKMEERSWQEIFSSRYLSEEDLEIKCESFELTQRSCNRAPQLYQLHTFKRLSTDISQVTTCIKKNKNKNHQLGIFMLLTCVHGGGLYRRHLRNCTICMCRFVVTAAITGA